MPRNDICFESELCRVIKLERSKQRAETEGGVFQVSLRNGAGFLNVDFLHFNHEGSEDGGVGESGDVSMEGPAASIAGLPNL